VERIPRGRYTRELREEARLEIEIHAADIRTRGTFGPERLQQDLAAYGVAIGIRRITGSGGSSGYGANR